MIAAEPGRTRYLNPLRLVGLALGCTSARLCNVTDAEAVWGNATEARKLGLNVEMVNLVIPRANDDEHCVDKIITRTLDGLGRDTPSNSPSSTRYTGSGSTV